MYNSLDYNNQNIEVIPQSKDKIIAINFEYKRLLPQGIFCFL
jgi:hypothetical protein